MVSPSRTGNRMSFVVVVLLSGCFDLHDLQPFPCAADRGCPDPFTCLNNQCVQVCVADSTTSECQSTCTMFGGTYCSSISDCVDTNNDDNNCGACNRRCTNGSSCSAGSCKSNLTLGRACTTNSDCPENAPECLNIGLSDGSSSPGFCTPVCDAAATTRTDASGEFSYPEYPAPDESICQAAYAMDVRGRPSCSLIRTWTPMDRPPKPSTAYNVSMSCLIRFETINDCAFGMTCRESTCLPSF